jgi:DNA-binding response OmpR family regulator
MPSPSGQAEVALRVLLVDDEQDYAGTLAKILTRRGLQVSCAFSGQEALEKLAASDYDVAVVDLKMPGMDGLELLERARRLRPRLQVIVLTAHGTVPAGIEVLRSGAADFLSKPVDSDALVLAITAIAQGSGAITES